MDAKLKELEQKLIGILTEIDSIKPIKFVDTDCDGSAYNYGGLEYNENTDEIYVNLSMWNDKLPVHQK